MKWIYSVNKSYTWWLDFADGYGLLLLALWPRMTMKLRVVCLACWVILLVLHLCARSRPNSKSEPHRYLIYFQIVSIFQFIIAVLIASSHMLLVSMTLSVLLLIVLLIIRNTRVAVVKMGGRAIVSTLLLPVGIMLTELVFR